ITQLRNGNAVFRREEDRFRTAVDILCATVEAHDDTPPPPRRVQDRTAESVAVGAAPAQLAALPLQFRNEPDTDPALAANRRWWEEHRDGGGGPALQAERLGDPAAVDTVVS